MDTWTADKVRDRVTDLIGYLTDHGLLHDRIWKTALYEVPRHLFVPEGAWANPNAWRGTARAINRKTNPTDWWNACYEASSIITQRDDGNADVTDNTATPTCSLSSPSISLPYLELLDLDDHHRVLEIGAGTGWTAGMLAWRLGSGQVATIEVDEYLGKQAEENLAVAGFAPLVHIGDGAEGIPSYDCWDRIHVTCGVRDIPYTWIEQTRPGGVIVLPWMPHPDQYGQQLRLDVLDDGTAVGSFCGGGGFMMLRSQRAQVPEAAPDGHVSTTLFDPRNLNAEGVQLALVAHAPGLAWADTGHRSDGKWVRQTTLWDLHGTSTATCQELPDGRWGVTQSGDRHLWDEAQAAYMTWARQGRPSRDRYQMTVTPDGQHITLNT